MGEGREPQFERERDFDEIDDYPTRGGNRASPERGGVAMMKPNEKPTNQPRMTLASVTRGRVERPMLVLLYGVEGVGKSTFAAGAPSPIFLASEDGTSELDVARFPPVEHWSDVFEAIDSLSRGEHSYQTLAIDTLDWLEPICWAHVVERGGPKVKSIEDFGYGKGYAAALDEWRVFLAALERLRKVRQMHVVMLAHSWLKPFKNPLGEDYDRYEMKLHRGAAGALREKSDVVLFARHETYADKDEKTKRVRGVGTGSRIVHTVQSAAWDAKNRYGLPESMPLDWSTFEAAAKAGRPADPEVLRRQIEQMLSSEHGAPVAERVRAAVVKAGDNSGQLAKIADHLSGQINIKAQESP